MRQDQEQKQKPVITNFRIRWDKVADLAAMTAVWVGTVWVMVLLTVTVFSL